MKNKTIGCSTMEKFDNRVVNTVGSSRIRVRWLLNYWEDAEEYVMGRDYEVMIYQKVYWKKMMETFKGVQILDICDPDWLEGKPVFEYVDLADATVTSSQPLADFIQKIRPKAKVVCIPDRIYLPEHQNKKLNHNGPIKKAVWFGYSANTHYLERTFDELTKRGITLTVISNQPYTPPYAYKQLEVDNIPYNYDTLHAELIANDVVLMPPPIGDQKAEFKSNNKTLTGWALGLPIVAMPEDFDRLNDPLVRKKEADKNLKEIEDHWDVRLSVAEYKILVKNLRKKYV